MTDPHIDSDRMPLLAHAGGKWTPVETAHLAGCAECRLEWELVQAASALGRAAASRIDPNRVAARVLHRLTEAPRRSSGFAVRPARWALALAAAAAIVLAFRIAGSHSPVRVAPSPARPGILHELDELTASELEAIFDAIPPAAANETHVESAPFGELDTNDLERVLRSLEG